ncbi:MAG TPA: ABC transporter substrate-binding protein [bacterium]|nr:ABC transporter substrate-binding protein [bacterium]
MKELLVYDYIDAAHMLSPLPLACALGIDGKKAELRVATIQNVNGQAFTLSIKHLSIRNVREMEGFTLGVPYKFSMHYYLLCYYLAANGLNPLKDVTIKEVVPPLMPYYLRKRILDGFLCADPFNQIPVHQKTGFIYILSKDIWYGHPCCSVATSQNFIDKYPNTYKVLLHSILEAEYRLHYATVEERKGIAKEISAPYYLDQEDYIPVAQSLSGEFPDGKGGTFFIPDRIDFIPYPWVEYGKWILSQMQRWSQLPGKVNYNDIVESVFETEENIELAKSLGFKVPYKPNLGGIQPFTGKDPFNYMIKQPFCAFVEEPKTFRKRTSIESYNTYFTDFNRHMAYVAGGNLDEQMEITDSGEVGLSQQLFNELTLNMRFMKNKLQESNEMLEQRVN